MNEQVKYIAEDEIDLRELFKTIWLKRWFIVIFTCVITLLAGTYAFLKTPIYEVKSNVRVGYIGSEPLEKPDLIVKMLNIVFNIGERRVNKEESFSEVTSIATNKKLKDFIEIKTQATTNKDALEKNKEVLKYMQKYYQPKLNKYIVDIENKIKNIKLNIENLEKFEKTNIENEIKVLKEQNIARIDETIGFLLNKKIPMLETKIEFYANNLDEYRKEIKKLYSTNKNNTETTIISIQMVNYQNLILDAKNAMEDLNFELLDIKNNQIPNLERDKENIINDTIRKLEHNLNVDLKNQKYNLEQEIKSYEYAISKQNIQNHNLVGEYIINDHPVKPKKKLIVVVAFVTGLILSIFLVFFMEFIKGFKEEK